jgi:hypothetical protein
MLKKQPTASAIRAANRNAVGGGRKRCRKGKNCSATCIDAGKDCLVGLPEPASQATTKVAAMLQQRQGGKASAAPQTQAAPTPPAQDPAKTAALLAGLKQYAPQKPPEQTPAQKTGKEADGAKLKKLEEEMEARRKTWADTIGKGDVQKTVRLGNEFQAAKKEHDDFKKELDEKYNKPATKSPKELMADEAKRVRDRMDERLEEGIKYWTPEQRAPILEVRKEMEKDFRKLSDDQLGALGLYGENKQKYYRDVNKFLRTGSMEGIPAERQQIVQNIIANLNGALDKLPAAPQTELARAVSGGGARNLANLKVGDVIEDKGFGSYTLRDKVTALDQFFRSGQDNALMRVTSRNARNVSPVMEFQRESEHILRPGTRLRVVEVIEPGGANAHRSRVVGSMPTYIFEEVE